MKLQFVSIRTRISFLLSRDCPTLFLIELPRARAVCAPTGPNRYFTSKIYTGTNRSRTNCGRSTLQCAYVTGRGGGGNRRIRKLLLYMHFEIPLRTLYCCIKLIHNLIYTTPNVERTANVVRMR